MCVSVAHCVCVCVLQVSWLRRRVSGLIFASLIRLSLSLSPVSSQPSVGSVGIWSGCRPSVYSLDAPPSPDASLGFPKSFCPPEHKRD